MVEVLPQILHTPALVLAPVTPGMVPALSTLRHRAIPPCHLLREELVVILILTERSPVASVAEALYPLTTVTWRAAEEEVMVEVAQAVRTNAAQAVAVADPLTSLERITALQRMQARAT